MCVSACFTISILEGNVICDLKEMELSLIDLLMPLSLCLGLCLSTEAEGTKQTNQQTNKRRLNATVSTEQEKKKKTLRFLIFLAQLRFSISPIKLPFKSCSVLQSDMTDVN